MLRQLLLHHIHADLGNLLAGVGKWVQGVVSATGALLWYGPCHMESCICIMGDLARSECFSVGTAPLGAHSTHTP